MELINVSFQAYMWTYDHTLHLCKEQLTSFQPVPDILAIFDLKKSIPEDMIETGDPLILENRFGMMFLIAFHHEDQLVTVCGPAFLARQSAEKMRQRMQESGMGVADTNKAMIQLTNLSIIPFSQMIQIGLMLHYSLNHEKISSDRVRFHTSFQNREEKKADSLPDVHAGIWETEKKFHALIRSGSPEALEYIRTMSVYSPGMRVQVKDPVRNAKNNGIVVLTMVSRDAIAGGLDSSISYSLNDLYADRIEKAGSVAEVTSLIEHLINDYLIRIQRSRTISGISRRIQNACDYIILHLEEKLTIEEIADHEGYTPYYFSKLFYKETGRKVSAWINHHKILLAEQMLRDTTLSISEIADEISFGSRSFFIASFKKETGMTPSAYRKQLPVKDVKQK